MTNEPDPFVALLNIANAAYPDRWLELMYDPRTGEILPDAEDQGDSLGLFILRELTDTFDQNAGSDRQLLTAANAIIKATMDLLTVSNALTQAGLESLRRKLKEVTDEPSRLPNQP